MINVCIFTGFRKLIDFEMIFKIKHIDIFSLQFNNAILDFREAVNTVLNKPLLLSGYPAVVAGGDKIIVNKGWIMLLVIVTRRKPVAIGCG